MKVEVGRFKDGRLMVKVVFEQDSNFRKETLSWVPTFEEVDHISKTLVSIDTVNIKEPTFKVREKEQSRFYLKREDIKSVYSF